MTLFDEERWDRVEAIVREALDQPAEDRDAFVARTCAPDEELLRQVRTLVDAHASMHGGAAFMDAPPHVDAGLLEHVHAITRDDATGRTVGRYVIRRRIAEGGMGAVYEAEQSDPRRLVALKILRGGALAGEHRIRLFTREVDSLARVKHPSVAALYDAGVTEHGERFIAMELVDGSPLTEYLTAHPSIDRRARLALFVRIADAIGYAHQRGIIHRDIKPANILVTDGGDVKVLDFGIARIVDEDGTPTTRTLTGAILGTLDYMSPEQVRGLPDDIDVRSDIYSLGVVLYEMLAGRLPYDLRGMTVPDAARVIAEREPHRPALGGDLDAIVLKALEKDPARRYESVSSFADDVRRFLAGHPVHARPATTLYQLRKLAARHRGVTIALSALACSLVLGIAGTSTALVRARRAEHAAREEAATAEQVTQFMQGMFKVSDPSESRGNTLTAREILDTGAERVDRELADQPPVRARLLQTIGAVYRSLGMHQKAAPLFERALAVRRTTSGTDDLDIAATHSDLAVTLRRLGDFPGALAHFDTCLTIRRERQGDAHVSVAGTLSSIGAVHFERGDYAQALSRYEESLHIYEKAGVADSAIAAACLYNLVLLYNHGEESAKALPLIERLTAIEERESGPDNLNVLNDRMVWAMTLEYLHRLPEARAMAVRALAGQERILGTDHPDVAEALSVLASIDWAMENYALSRDEYRRVVNIFERTLGPSHFKTAISLDNLAGASRRLGDLEGARREGERALRIGQATLGADHVDVATIEANLAQVLMLLHEMPRARRHAEHAVQAIASGADTLPRYVAQVTWTLAMVEEADGRISAARTQYESAERAFAVAKGLHEMDVRDFRKDYERFRRAHPDS